MKRTPQASSLILTLVLTGCTQQAVATDGPQDTSTTTSGWDCARVNVPLGQTLECTSPSQTTPLRGPAYECESPDAKGDSTLCPPLTLSEGAELAAPHFFCTEDESRRVCRRAPECMPGAHRVQMDCDVDVSVPLGDGGASSDGGSPPFGGDGDGDGPVGQTECYYPTGTPPGTGTPAATVYFVLDTTQGPGQLYVRLTFNPSFVDNTYGTTAVGWSKGHTFKDLVGSDHAELGMYDRAGQEKLHFKLDYLSKSTTAPSGYASLGVTGGEGRMILGSASAILKSNSSLDRNLNERGYGSYVVSSPATTAQYTPNPATPQWDYRVIYETWIANSAFGSSGFGHSALAFVHASPSKTGTNTVTVTPGPCPSNG